MLTVYHFFIVLWRVIMVVIHIWKHVYVVFFFFFFKKEEGIKTMQNCVLKIQKQLKNVTLKELSEGSAH